MATKVGLENNILKVNDGVKIKYLNASWVSMYFDDTKVYLRYNSEERLSLGILFTEFQDLAATHYTTEVAIATYLSDKIG